MPPPRRTSLAVANRIFVDRTEPQIAFERSAFCIPADRATLLVYYGVGGQGKTALCRELLRKTDPDIEPSYGFLCRALVDLHGRPKTDPDLLLIWIRNGFAKAGVSTPCFDLAFAVAWDATRGEQPLPVMESAWLARQKDVAGEFTSEAFTRVGEALSEAATSIPVFGKLFSFAAKWSVKKGYEQYLHRTRNALEEMYRGADLKQPNELSQLLPWMLAQDLNHYLAANPEARFALFIDEYERVFDEGGAGSLWRDNPFDRHVRSFVQETNGLLAVFFSRERLPWDDDPAWQADLAGAQHLLGGLSDADADDFLRAVPIDDLVMRKAMIAGARETSSEDSAVYPLMLDLQVEHWRELGAQGKPMSPDTFSLAASEFVARRNDIIKRVLRDYAQPMQSTLIRLACARRFDRLTFEHVVRTFSTGLPFDAFDRLEELSFINRTPDGYLSFHGIVRDVLVELLAKEERTRAIQILFEHFDARSKAQSVREIGAGHAAALFEAAHLRWQLQPRDFAHWLVKASEPLLEAAKYNECLELWRQALTTVQSKYGEADIDCAVCILELSKIMAAQHSHREAVRLGEQALEIFGGINAMDTPGAVEAATVIGQALQFLGDNSRAKAVLEQAVEGNLRVHGRIHRDAAVALSSLGLVHRNEGNYELAARTLNDALSIHEEVSGSSHQNVAAGLSNLAVVLEEQGKRREAKPLLERALAISEQSLGADHPSVGLIAGNLANILRNGGDREAALALYEKSLAISEKTFGPDHPNTALSLSNLLQARGNDGAFEEVRMLYLKAISSSEKALGVDHPQTITIIENLAHLYSENAMHEEAMALLGRSLTAREKVLGPEHPDTALAVSGFARLLSEMGQHEKALPLLKRALETYEKSLGPDHEMTGAVLTNLARCLTQTGNLEDSDPLLRRALAIREQVYGPDHPETAEALSNLADLLSARERYDEELVHRRRVVSILEKAFGLENLHTGDAVRNLALALWSTGDLTESERLLEQAIAVMEKSVGEGHPETIYTVTALARLVAQAGQLERAKSLQLRALNASEKTFGPKALDVTYRLNDIALILEAQENFADAKQFFERALSIAGEIRGADHPELQTLIENIARVGAALDNAGSQGPDIASKPSIH